MTDASTTRRPSIPCTRSSLSTTDSAVSPRSATPELAGRAVALQEALRDKKDLPLTSAERHLLTEWLKRLADSG
jgi:hypothetical protein